MREKSDIYKLKGILGGNGQDTTKFAIDPEGNFLLVANQESNEIIIFRRDRKAGLLTQTGRKIGVIKPVCLKFSHIN